MREKARRETQKRRISERTESQGTRERDIVRGKDIIGETSKRSEARMGAWNNMEKEAKGDLKQDRSE